jgi:hypothetical protein
MLYCGVRLPAAKSKDEETALYAKRKKLRLPDV